jgi:hypothetical protein
MLSAFRTRGVRKPTSKFVAACPCLDGLAQDGTQGEMRPVLSRTGGVLVVGVTSIARERKRESEPVPPFYRCKERVQMYNGGCSYALTCLAEKCLSHVYMPTWLPEKCLSPVFAITWPSEKC